ncbi:MAG: ABC transporter substrate-binding protein [Clostridia bacterium]|nr:ABC transporter substrate-binding protein [Clostridia bacterium]
MFKKILSVLMVVAMVACLFTACGGNEDAGKTDATTFKIGAIGPTTGDAAIYGQAVMNAAQLAVDEINAAGGINGAQIEFKPADDEHNAEKSVNAYNDLKDWGMQILMGTVTSTPCIAVVEETHNDNMFMLTPSGSAVDCIRYDNAFRVCFSDPNQGLASADYIAAQKLGTKIAVIYNSSDAYSSGIYEKFMAEAKVKNLNVVAEGAFTADSNKDFTVQLQQAKSAGADLLFLPIYYQEASLILAQADKMGYDPAVFGVDGMDGILTVENFDTALAEGVMLLTPFAADAEDKLTQDFVTAYKAKYNEVPNQFAADAYDAIYIIKAAIEKSGATPDMSVSDLCNAIKGAMTQITVDGVTGLGMTWTADGEPNKAPKGMKIQNGAYVAM